VSVSFAHPELAPIFAAALAIAGLAVATIVRRQRALTAFGGRGAAMTSASPMRQIVKAALLLIACLSLAAAFVGPQIGDTPRRAASGTVDTVIALDVSQSMAARDVAPDRLHVAQQAIEQIGQELAGARVGLTLFAGTSVVRYPLTADTKIVGPALDTSGRGFRITPGSSLRAALQGAAALFPTTATANARPKAIVLVSDGEDLSSELPLIEPLRQRNIAVFTLGIGTPEGAPVPVYDQSNKFIQFIVDANGTQVISKLDEGRMQSLAAAAGGRYWRYQGEATAQDIANALRAIDAGPVAAQTGVSPEDRYQIFLAIAIAALLAEWLLDERRPMPRPRLPHGRPLRRRLLGGLASATMLFAACGPTDPLASDVDAANELYQRDPPTALERFKTLAAARPASPEIAIDLANTYAKLGDYDRALVQYARGLDNAKGQTRAIAFYDRGNALFRQGRLLDARASYMEALRLDPTDRDAKFNIEIIDRLLRTVEQTRPKPQGSPPASAQPQPGPPGGGSTGASGASGVGVPSGTPQPGASGAPQGTPPPSVQSALNDFRKDLTPDEALRLLDALRNEQRGIEGLIDGTGVRRGGNVDVPY
jgi:Ca-activated chloride channel family protein